VKWIGLDELQEELRRLPEDLTNQAGQIVLNAANTAKSQIKYPGGTKDELNQGLRVDIVSAGKFGVKVVAKNTSKLAQIFEHGTAVRHIASGASRGQIAKPTPGNYFLPPVIRNRRAMYERLKQMLVDNGLQVRGTE
jgi:hypothetical protein